VKVSICYHKHENATMLSARITTDLLGRSIPHSSVVVEDRTQSVGACCRPQTCDAARKRIRCPGAYENNARRLPSLSSRLTNWTVNCYCLDFVFVETTEHVELLVPRGQGED
jgi:hypothetical protein